MQRWTSVAFAIFLAAAVTVVVWQARLRTRPADGAPAPSGSSAGAGTALAGPDAAEAPVDEPAVLHGDAGPDAQAFNTLPNGKPAPGVPATAPKIVSFGVILFSYKGAESAPKTAPTREEALERARSALLEAKKDFAEAAKKGDHGSTGDAGRIPQGVLEPAVEYVLFTLPKDGVCDEPIDTPRGWWIVRRND